VVRTDLEAAVDQGDGAAGRVIGLA